MKFKTNKGAGYRRSVGRVILDQLSGFAKKLSFVFSRLSRGERFIFFVLLSTFIVLVIFESLKIYYANTVIVPTNGGEYVEVINGEAKYFSPVLAKSDAERSVSRLIYSSLIKIDEQNQPQPDLASAWEVSADGLVYTFHLRQDILFQNGEVLDSDDVVATLEAIRDESNKSPLRDVWANVTSEAIDDWTVVFTLPRQYGPFIYNCTFGVMDSMDVPSALSSNYNGTGPYKFNKAAANEKDELEVGLDANSGYFQGDVLISKLKFMISKNYPYAKKDLEDLNILATAGVSSAETGYRDMKCQTGRNMILFMNVRKEPLNNIELRKTIVAEAKVEQGASLKLLSLDAEPQRSKASELTAKFRSQNIIIEESRLSSTDYIKAVASRDYDMLLYGYDWAYDLDPYLLWHSSQLEKSNFSGFSSKQSDIFLEDTRMILDYNERTIRYQQYSDETVKANALAIIFDKEQYPLNVSEKVKDVEIGNCGRPEDRFNNIMEWYIKEKRVKK